MLLNEKKILYKDFLKTINNIRFTLREVDVIACIIHSRGTKKIASILDIGPKTVSLHIYNIMQKVGCNLQDQIIDLIEKSGKIILFRKYYSILLIDNLLNNMINRVSPYVRNKKYCLLLQKSTDTDEELIEHLARDLKKLNIKITSKNTQEEQVVDCTSQFQEFKNAGYFLLITCLVQNTIKDQKIDDILYDFKELYSKISI